MHCGVDMANLKFEVNIFILYQYIETLIFLSVLRKRKEIDLFVGRSKDEWQIFDKVVTDFLIINLGRYKRNFVPTNYFLCF